MKSVKLIALIALTILIGVLIIQNIAPVEARLLFASVQLPLIVLLLLAGGSGFLIGLIIGGWHRTSKHSKSTPTHRSDHSVG